MAAQQTLTLLVGGSSPFSVAGNLQLQVPYFIGVWLSLVERYVRDVEVAGSNPVTPMSKDYRFL